MLIFSRLEFAHETTCRFVPDFHARGWLLEHCNGAIFWFKKKLRRSIKQIDPGEAAHQSARIFPSSMVFLSCPSVFTHPGLANFFVRRRAGGFGRIVQPKAAGYNNACRNRADPNV